jgi:hypothetical protein
MQSFCSVPHIPLDWCPEQSMHGPVNGGGTTQDERGSQDHTKVHPTAPCWFAQRGARGRASLATSGKAHTEGPESPGIDEKKLDSARALGKRVAGVAAITKRGSKPVQIR